MSDNKYQTILIISLGFIAIGFIINDAWPYYVAFGVGTLTLISKNIAELIVKLWFGLAKILAFRFYGKNIKKTGTEP